MIPNTPSHELAEMAALYAAGALTPEEAAAFEARLATEPDCLLEFRKLEPVVAALFAAVEPLPPPPSIRDALGSRITADAQAREKNAGAVLSSAGNEPRFPEHRTGKPSNASRQRWFAASGWFVAAASLLIAVGLWWNLRNRVGPPSPEEQRLALLIQLGQPGSDVMKLDWTATKDPAAKGASGDVVWSTSAQKGFMRFHGLPVNAPGVYEYQLWLFDPERDERFPVNGGVFDIPPADGDVIVPIKPELRVQRPTLFAVTIEKPGGVVVSSRERLPLLAKGN